MPEGCLPHVHYCTSICTEFHLLFYPAVYWHSVAVSPGRCLMRPGGTKFKKKQKEPEQPRSPLSEDAVVIKYLLWLTGERTEFGKWDQLKALEYTESTSRAASCSFALFLCSAQKSGCKPLPQNGNPKFANILHDSSLLCTTISKIYTTSPRIL